MKVTVSIFLIFVLALFSSCDSNHSDSQLDSSIHNAVLTPHVISGVPVRDYTAEVISPEQNLELTSDFSKRRQLAWRVFKKITTNVESTTGADTGVPLWASWYEASEVEQWNLKKIKPAGKYGFSDDQINKILKANSTFNPRQLSSTEFLARTQNTAGNNFGQPMKEITGHVLISPAYLKHVLKHFNNLNSKRISFATDTFPFAINMPEFPANAVMVKVVWQGSQWGVPVYDSSKRAATLMAKAKNPRWTANKIVDSKSLTDEKIFSVTTKDNQRFVVRAIHLVTKEVPFWVWVSAWWHDQPEGDFGQDRPANITNAWKNYKISITTDFEEKSPNFLDANGRKELESYTILAGAMNKKFGDETRRPTFGSNPYLETNNPFSNCVNCHGGRAEGFGDSGIVTGIEDFSFHFNSVLQAINVASGADSP